jgi:hypothetical protein
MRACLLMACLALFTAACEPVEEEDTCVPLDTPTFANVYDLVLVQSCAIGGSCHAADPGAGDLNLSDAETAYDSLVDGVRVSPGDASGSTVIVRINSGLNHAQHMPPGQLLGEPELCMIERWIAEGADP